MIYNLDIPKIAKEWDFKKNKIKPNKVAPGTVKI